MCIHIVKCSVTNAKHRQNVARRGPAGGAGAAGSRFGGSTASLCSFLSPHYLSCRAAARGFLFAGGVPAARAGLPAPNLNQFWFAFGNTSISWNHIGHGASLIMFIRFLANATEPVHNEDCIYFPCAVSERHRSVNGRSESGPEPITITKNGAATSADTREWRSRPSVREPEVSYRVRGPPPPAAGPPNGSLCVYPSGQRSARRRLGQEPHGLHQKKRRSDYCISIPTARLGL
ncbi:hypothetical protein EVAR_4996_1 [Eumeta japonica]|uniref:Uncharacterized protein n=1 Tax=Eumeta variegata TaxID=151549 RepID=A0A4C1V0G6_EUMVA|nr:hypothetical protein EVAR_4996_1 [Eumeta japonica]